MLQVLTIVVATSLFPASLAADDLGVDSQYAEYYSYIMEQNETCYSDFANVSFEGEILSDYISLCNRFWKAS